MNYLYAVTRWFDAALVARVGGVDGAPVRLIRYDDIAAVVSSLGDEDAVRGSLSTLAGLEQVARAHHDVVDGVAAHAVTLPCRLATLHRDDQEVLDLLRREYRMFVQVLDRLEGYVELGVKLYVDQAAEPSPDPSGAGATSGRDYLRRRSAQLRSRENSWRHAAEVAERVDRTLSTLAADSVRHRPQPAQLPGAAAGNILNAAYLVATELVEDFAVRAGRAVSAGTRIEVTGPWAPYSFAGPDRQRDDAARGRA